MQNPKHVDRRSLSSALAVSLVASLLVLIPLNEQPALAAIDKTLIRFANLTCDLVTAGYLGSGTAVDPYLISDSSALWESADCGGSGKFFKLTNDIDLQGETAAPTTSPIGFSQSDSLGKKTFQGVFDGQNFSIKNISISSNAVSGFQDNVGLFWRLGGAEFRNLTLTGQVAFNGPTSSLVVSTGAISGFATSATFSSISNHVDVTGNWQVGGLVGNVGIYATVSSSVNYGAISGSKRLGGIIGFAARVWIMASENYGNVTSTAGYAAGMVGEVQASGRASVFGSTNFGLISGATGNSGGILGSINSSALVENSQNFGVIFASGSGVGGIVGWSQTGAITISGSVNAATVSGGQGSGGIFGLVVSGGPLNIFNSTNSGAISTSMAAGSDSMIGGVVGYSLVTVLLEKLTNTGTISSSGRARSGGLVGQVASSLRVVDSYNLGTVRGGASSGGILGYGSMAVTLSGTTNQGNLIANGANTGGLVGSSLGSLGIEDSTNSGQITATGQSNVGGLVGNVDNRVTIQNSFNSGSVNGADRLGGLVGGSAVVLIASSANSGNITSTTNTAGGLVARLGSPGESIIISSRNTGNVSTVNDNAGGLVGQSYDDALISSSHNSGVVSGRDNVGGLIGYQRYSTFQVQYHFSYNTATISGRANVGGLVGLAEGAVSMSSVFNHGAVEATGDYSGGLVGQAQSTSEILNSYNKLTVEGDSYVGGIIGWVSNSATLENVYNAGTLSATSLYDSLIGDAQTPLSINLVSVYALHPSSFSPSFTLTQMQSATLYTGWDFVTIWGFGECSDDNGLPLLRFANLISTYYTTGCYTAPVVPAATESPTVSSESVSAVPEQSPQPYRGPMIFAFLQPATAGAVVILDGIRLVGISYVGLGEMAVSYSVVSSISLSVVVPTTLTPSEYDLLVLSTEGKLTVVRALRVIDPVVSIPGPVLSDRAKALLGKTQALPKFQRSQQGISTNQANWLRDRLEGSGLSKIVCTGVIQQSMTMHQKIQIRMRAMQVCLEAQRYLPNATVLHQSKLTTNWQSVGRVLVSFLNTKND